MRVIDGTKGGRPRMVPIVRVEQVEALARAAAVQDGRSMVPGDARYVDSQCACRRGRRHADAQARYEALAGAPCPVAPGIKHGKARYAFLAERPGLSLGHAKAWDIENRKVIAEEPGHGRIGIANAYLG